MEYRSRQSVWAQRRLRETDRHREQSERKQQNKGLNRQWPLRDMVELKTTPKLREASASSTTESPSFNDLSPSNFLSCCGVPSNRNSVFDGLRRSLLDAIQDCTSSKTADSICIDESHDRLSNEM